LPSSQPRLALSPSFLPTPLTLALSCRSLHDALPIYQSSEDYQRLAKDLGAMDAVEFLVFARRYYSEVAQAQQGIWIDKSPNNLLERADLNPPTKAKIKHLLVSNILYEKFTPHSFDNFVEQVWNAKVHGNSTVRSIC